MAFEIIASLNTAGSIKEISEKLSNEVNAGVNAKQPLKIVATIDVSKTIEQINNSLSGLKGLTIKNLSVDSSAIQDVQKQIADATNKNNQSLQQMTAVVDTANQSVKNIADSFVNLTRADTSSFTAVFTNGMLDADATIKKIENRFKELQGVVDVTAKGMSFPTVVGMKGDTPIMENMLRKIIVSMKNAEGESRTLAFSLREVDGILNTFAYDSANYSDKGIGKQAEKIKATIISLTSEIDNYKKKVTDVNGIKPITSNMSGYDKLEEQYKKVITSIENLKNTNSSTMASMKAEVDTNIQEYKRLADSIQKANYPSTSLRAKDINTSQKVEEENLKKFIAQINNSKIPISAFKEELNSLNSIISLENINKTQLIDFINRLDIAKAKFKTLSEQYKNSGSEGKTYYDRIIQNLRQLDSLQKKRITAIDKNESQDVIKLLDEQIKRLKERNRYNEKQISKKNLANDDTSNYIANLKRQYEWEQKLLSAQLESNKSKQQIKEQEQALKQYNKTIDDTINKLNKQSNVNVFGKNSNDASVVAVRTTIEGLITKYNQLKSTMGEIKTPEQFKEFENELAILDGQFNKTIGYAKNLQNQFANDNSSVTLTNKIQTLRNQIERFMSNNGKAMNNGYRSQFDTLLNQLNTIANTGDFNKAKAKFQELTNEINKLGLRGNSVMDSLKQKLTKFASWMGLTMITASISREIRGMYSDIITLDTALVDLNKTFQGTSAELESVYNSANEIAKELGVTTEQVINQASAWSRLGWT